MACDGFFEWKKYYRLEKPGLMFDCALCEAIHSTKRNTRKVHDHFDKHWYKNKYYGRIKLLRAEALLYANRLH